VDVTRLNLRRRILFRVTGHLQCRLIRVEREEGGEPAPYLERYKLLNLPWGDKIYIHRFMDSDPARGYHNHPWQSISFPIVGGYIEHRFHPIEEVVTDVKPGWFNIIGQDTFHRVDLNGVDAWTMFCRRGTANGWGFLDTLPGMFQAAPANKAGSAWVFRRHHEVTDDDNGWVGIPVGNRAPREPLRV
jgi:hypothetical protein